jgi:glucose-6-phosphate 1-dehydrogenase
MKGPLLLVAALLVLGFVVMKQTERFQPEFLDKKQVQKTVSVEDSSYEQMTNHMTLAPYSMGPIEGTPSPFQVNQYRAHIQ